MGCDIHIMIEAKRRTAEGWSDRWYNVDNWRHNPYYGEWEDEPEMVFIDIYTGRDYELFSFLADVRNYGGNPSFGFDRGIPEDASDLVAKEYKSWGDDAHTPGYCTLAELKEKASTVSKVSRKGYVHKDEAQRFHATGETPTSWCQGVGGPHASQYKWLEWEDEIHCFDKLLSAIEERKRDVFWIFRPEDDDGKCDDKIRIVFWFDN